MRLKPPPTAPEKLGVAVFMPLYPGVISSLQSGIYYSSPGDVQPGWKHICPQNAYPYISSGIELDVLAVFMVNQGASIGQLDMFQPSTSSPCVRLYSRLHFHKRRVPASHRGNQCPATEKEWCSGLRTAGQ